MHDDVKLKVGIVGCGNIASIQLKYITNLIDKDNIALCDLNPVRLEYLANLFKIRNTYADVSSLVNEFHPNVVHILTPPQTHREIALACLGQGMHVFLEKPMCVTLEEAETIVQAARSKNLLVCVDHLRVFDPLVMRVKDLLASGSFGDLIDISITEVDNYLERKSLGIVPGWLTALPGEIFFDLLPHHLSILGEFLPDLQVEGLTYQIANGELSALTCLLSSPKGSATVHLSLVSHPFRNEVTWECTNGFIQVNFRDFFFTAKKRGQIPAAVDRMLGNIRLGGLLMANNVRNVYRFLRGKLDPYAGMGRLIENFYAAIKGQGESPVPGEDGLSTIKLIQDILQRIPCLRESKSRLRPASEGGAFQDCDILVTGGSGFIGKRLVARLTQQGHKVRILTHRRLQPEEVKEFGPRVEVVVGDITSLPDVVWASTGVRQIYHLAAATRGNWFNHLDASVVGTKNVMAAAAQAQVSKLVYTSTIGLLNATQYPQDGLIDEAFPYEEHPEKRGSYSYAKGLAEKLVLAEADKMPGLKVIILRPGLVYGPGKNPLFDVVQQVSRRLRVSLSPGKRLVPLVYVENLVDALILAGETAATGIFNVVDQEAITVREFIKGYKQVTGERFVTFYLPRWCIGPLFGTMEKVLALLQGSAPAIVYKLRAVGASVRHSTARIEQTLGWRSAVPFRDALKKTLASGSRPGN